MPLFREARRPLNVYEAARRNRRRLLAGEKRLVNATLAAWREAEREIRRKLARSMLLSLDEPTPGREVARIRYERLLAETREEIARYSMRAEDLTRAQQAANVVLATQGVGEMLVAGGTARAGFVRLPVEAFEDVVGFLRPGAPLRELFDAVADDAVRVARQSFYRGVSDGENPRVIARRLFVGLGDHEPQIQALSRDRCLTIARTETMRAYRIAQHRNYQANADLVTGWRWLSGRGRRTCPACLAMDGTEHPLTEQMSSHPMCRCTAVPVLRYGDFDAGTGEDWLKGQPKEVQRDILGAGRYEAWLAGVPLREMATPTRSERWGAGVAVTPVSALRSRFPGAFGGS